ncbi:uncharacterized protein LOC106661513 [Cimex lectularius]|uniref:Uncharacterized protein n=1 Tax=Cimex lectularius TaxID=79782 RepID=A0A8I6R7S4_CIMLE|nr:uncharacterized protein LOC106661513 [Cimex lectularius]
MELEDCDDSKGKKKAKKRWTNTKKVKNSKPNQTMKVDDESAISSQIIINDNAPPTCGSPSPEDEAHFMHLILTSVLNKKKMELLESEEVMEALLAKRARCQAPTF